MLQLSFLDQLESNMDHRVAARHINSIVEDHPTGKCAKHVRLALMKGGVPLQNWPVNAKEYRNYLLRYGFEEVPKQGYLPQIGDVVVLEQHPGGHPAGHIAMYDGDNWVSDFQQRDHWGGPGWRDNQTDHVFLRST